MAEKKINPNEAVAERSWFFPTLGVSVTAPTQEEALTLATSQEKREDGDGII